ncbi:unnamed protein product [Schistosoma margrebowiei]|uniref:Uncharacterized protein n=1 Tax=Schistosoma margrebowiei TaxID=48269 RepID=A0AA85AQ22_9TREM|nr:unnamed protein product [Schistosoma margrebowiei]
MNYLNNPNDQLIKSMNIPEKTVHSLNKLNLINNNNNNKSIIKSKLKPTNDKNLNQFKQKSNKVQSTKRFISKTNLCRLQDLCLEDRYKLNQLIMKLAEAQEALNQMDSKLKEQSIKNNNIQQDNMLISNQFINSKACSLNVEQKVCSSSNTDQFITFYKTKLEHLENELCQLRCNFKKEQSMPKCENNQSMETLIEINPTIMNDVEQMEQLKQSNKNVNTLTKQSSSHCVNHNYQYDQHLNDNDMKTNYDLSQTVNNEQKITSINNHNTNSQCELSVKSTNKKHITRNQKATNFKQKNCSNLLPVWEFINANDNSIVNIQCMNTLTHHQTIKKNISIMTEPVDRTIQSITCSVEKSTQTIVNEFNDKCLMNHPVELTTSISTPTSLHSNVILNHENNKSLVNSSVQTDSVNHHNHNHHHHVYDYYNNLTKRNNKVNKTRKCVKSKIQNNQTRRPREYKRKRMKNRLVQEKSESFSSSSCSFSSSSSSNSSISSSFLSKKNETFDVDRNNHMKLTSSQIQEGNHQIVQDVKQLNVSNDTPSINLDKTRSSLPEDDEKETGCIELINKSLPHCKLIQGQRQQQQQNESIIEINSDKELESIIQLMNETFQDNHLSNSIQNKMNPYGKQYTSMYTCKHLNITMNNNDNNQLMKQTRSFLSNPYQQESQFIRNNKPYFKQTNKQEQQYDHINTNYDYDDDADEDDDQFYPSSNCQNEQWYNIIDHDCHKSNITEVHLEKEKEKEEEEEEEQLLSDLFFISN